MKGFIMRLPVDVKKALKGSADAFKEGKKQYAENFKDFTKIDEGEYPAVITEMEVGTNEDRLIIKPKYKITGDEFSGRTLFGNTLWLHNSGGVAWFIKFLAVLGKEIDDLTEESLSEVITEILKEKVSVIVKVSYEKGSEWPKVELSRINDSDTGDDTKTGDDKSNDEKNPEDEVVDLSDMTREQLKELIKNEGHDIKVGKSWTDDDIREAIMEITGGGDAGNDDTNKNETPDIEEMTLNELVEYAEGNGYAKKIPGYKKLTRLKLLVAINALSEKKKEEEEFTPSLSKKDFDLIVTLYCGFPAKVKTKEEKKAYLDKFSTEEKRIEHLSKLVFTAEDCLLTDHEDIIRRAGLAENLQ